MLEKLREEAENHRNKLVMIPIARLAELKEELEEFQTTEDLNGFQNWIFSSIYDFSLKEADFPVKALIVVAVPHPMYVNLNIHYKGKVCKTRALAVSDMNQTKEYIAKVAKAEGYHVREIWSLPLKRFAVQGGLATYGRNNITYVEGYGSNISYTAFLTDAESEEDLWRPMEHAKFCDSCGACINACPTGAIRENRFLINNERCLSCLNENEKPLPDWLPKNIHHTLYDCLRCQENCPMNLSAKDPNEVIQNVEFSEEETQMLLDGKTKEELPEEFVKRVEILGIFSFPVPIARNLRVLLEANE